LLALITLTAASSIDFAEGAPVQSPQFAVRDTRVEWSEGDQDISVVHVHITMKFTNDSDKIMILSRLLVPHLDVKIEDPLGKVVQPIDQYDLGHNDLCKDPNPTQFETIPPGASATREFTVSFFVSKNSVASTHAASPQGLYKTSATLSTWPFWDDDLHARVFF
jgi:hypothetical protein